MEKRPCPGEDLCPSTPKFAGKGQQCKVPSFSLIGKAQSDTVWLGRGYSQIDLTMCRNRYHLPTAVQYESCHESPGTPIYIHLLSGLPPTNGPTFGCTAPWLFPLSLFFPCPEHASPRVLHLDLDPNLGARPCLILL